MPGGPGIAPGTLQLHFRGLAARLKGFQRRPRCSGRFLQGEGGKGEEAAAAQGKAGRFAAGGIRGQRDSGMLLVGSTAHRHARRGRPSAREFLLSRAAAA
jgi:hypothetical protein